MRNKLFSTVLSLGLALSVFTSSISAAEAPKSAKQVNSVTASTYSGKVDVGGFGMYINIQGERKDGSPTVVFENGNGDDLSIWDLVAPEVAKKTKIVTYDRIGMGQSDSPGRNTVDYTAQGEAQRLHILLQNANVTGPIVLAVHSIGGLYAREYQHLYPNDVKGIVFVDSATEHQQKYLFPTYSPEDQLVIMDDDLTNGTGIPVELSITDFVNSSMQLDAVRVADSLRNLPITVLSGANHGYPAFLINMEQYWAERQIYLKSLSNQATQTIDLNNGHYLHQKNPQLVITAVDAMVAQVTAP